MYFSDGSMDGGDGDVLLVEVSLCDVDDDCVRERSVLNSYSAVDCEELVLDSVDI